jgi:hypothetical protein
MYTPIRCEREAKLADGTNASPSTIYMIGMRRKAEPGTRADGMNGSAAGRLHTFARRELRQSDLAF